jgi:hypothetical protein
LSKTTDTFGENADGILEDAVRYAVSQGTCSTSGLQRQFKIGYSRALVMIETMEKHGIVGPSDGQKPREVLLLAENVDALFSETEKPIADASPPGQDQSSATSTGDTSEALAETSEVVDTAADAAGLAQTGDISTGQYDTLPMIRRTTHVLRTALDADRQSKILADICATIKRKAQIEDEKKEAVTDYNERIKYQDVRAQELAERAESGFSTEIIDVVERYDDQFSVIRICHAITGEQIDTRNPTHAEKAARAGELQGNLFEENGEPAAAPDEVAAGQIWCNTLDNQSTYVKVMETGEDSTGLIPVVTFAWLDDPDELHTLNLLVFDHDFPTFVRFDVDSESINEPSIAHVLLGDPVRCEDCNGAGSINGDFCNACDGVGHRMPDGSKVSPPTAADLLAASGAGVL